MDPVATDERQKRPDFRPPLLPGQGQTDRHEKSAPLGAGRFRYGLGPRAPDAVKITVRKVGGGGGGDLGRVDDRCQRRRTDAPPVGRFRDGRNIVTDGKPERLATTN